MASCLVRSSPERAVRGRTLAADTVLCSNSHSAVKIMNVFGFSTVNKRYKI